MSPEQIATLAELARLRQEIGSDRLAMSRCLADAIDVAGRWKGAAPERPYLFMAAVAVHGWYTGLETLLERIARLVDRTTPEGETWHRELLSQATVEVPGLRPAVLPRSLFLELLALLEFRHFFRHAYGVELDTGRLRASLDRLLRVAPEVAAALGEFESFLARAMKGLV